MSVSFFFKFGAIQRKTRMCLTALCIKISFQFENVSEQLPENYVSFLK